MRLLRGEKLLMAFFIIFLVLVYMVLPVLLLWGALALLMRLLTVLQRRGVGKWLFAPFRAWAGMDETRRPKP